MAVSQRIQSSTLEAFFCFNPLLGNENTEGKKILFFHPQTVSLDRQKDYVGITEGLSVFTKDFSQDENCSAVHCEKKRYAFYECEPDYWVVLVVNNPMIETSSKNGQSSVEYLEEELENDVLQAILKQCYGMFRLFNGTMRSLVNQSKQPFLVDNHDSVRAALNVYMNFFIPTVRFQQLPFFTDINGFQFLSLDKSTFLTVQYLCSLICSNFSNVKHCGVMYDSKLIWSSINQEDMFLLYNLDHEFMLPFYTYLCFNQDTKPVSTIDLHVKIPASSTQTEDNSTPVSQTKTIRERILGKKSIDKKENEQKSAKVTDPGYLTGPLRAFVNSDKEKDARTRNAPRIFLKSDDSNATQGKIQRLVVYEKFLTTLFLIVEDEEDVLEEGFQLKRHHSHSKNEHTFAPPLQFYHTMEKFVMSNLKKLSTMLYEQSLRANSMNQRTENQFRFLYFNHMNLALKSSLNAKSTPLSMETIKIIRSIHKDFASPDFKNKTISDEDTSPDETYVKTKHHGWIVGRRATQSHREFFVVIDDNVSNLSDIKEEVDKLSRSFFHNIFVH